MLNNPLRYIDPSGHRESGPCGPGDICDADEGDGNSGITGSGGDTDIGGYDSGDDSSGNDDFGLESPETNDPHIEKYLELMELCKSRPFAPQCQVIYSPSEAQPQSPYYLFLFWDNIASPGLTFLEANDFYRLTSKGGWQYIRKSLPTGPLEATVAALRQGVRDSWWKTTYTPGERFLRILIAGGETFATDYVAGVFGEVAGTTGTIIGGPLGGAGGFIFGNTAATNAADNAWNNFNQNYMPWGPWP